MPRQDEGLLQWPRKKKYEFHKIYNGKLLEQIEIMERFEENIIERNNLLNPR